LERTLSLPEGDWFDFWSDAAYRGGQAVAVCAPLERLSVFVRAGASIPLVEHGETAARSLCLRVYPGDYESTLYEDGGHADDYAAGNFRWTYMTTRLRPHGLSMTRRLAGRFAPAFESLTLEIVGLHQPPADVIVDRRS